MKTITASTSKPETFEHKTVKHNIILKSDLEIFVKFNLTISVSVKLIEQFVYLLSSYAFALFLKYQHCYTPASTLASRGRREFSRKFCKATRKYPRQTASPLLS